MVRGVTNLLDTRGTEKVSMGRSRMKDLILQVLLAMLESGAGAKAIYRVFGEHITQGPRLVGLSLYSPPARTGG